MPVYEYRCGQCGKVQSVLVRRVAPPSSFKCNSCGGSNLQRLLSSFAFHRAWQSRTHEATSPGDYSDPRQIGRRAEQRFREMGQEVPREVREMIDKARDGELPHDVKDV